MRAYLFASPVAHSISPIMHQAAFSYAGIKAEYIAEDISKEQLVHRLSRFTARDYGANLSLPHKETALHLMNELTPTARAVGAINTIIHRNGLLIGENTDAAGFYAALGTHRRDRTVILGAGGAARAALYALLRKEHQAQQIFIVNRTHERAQLLAQSWGSQVQACAMDQAPWEHISLVVNTSSAELHNDSISVPWSRLSKEAVLYDMLYSPRRTQLMADAQEAGLYAENGLRMLAHQAQLAFWAWTGQEVPVRVFWEAAQSC